MSLYNFIGDYVQLILTYTEHRAHSLQTSFMASGNLTVAHGFHFGNGAASRSEFMATGNLHPFPPTAIATESDKCGARSITTNHKQPLFTGRSEASRNNKFNFDCRHKKTIYANLYCTTIRFHYAIVYNSEIAEHGYMCHTINCFYGAGTLPSCLPRLSIIFVQNCMKLQ